MHNVHSKYFGVMPYEETSVLVFPEGLLGFELEREFVPIRQPSSEPMVFLQSLSTQDLCFIALPAQAACPNFPLQLSREDRVALGFPPNATPQIGTDLLCLTIVSIEESGEVTANLLGPIVVNLRNRQARQCIQTESEYSHRFPLRAEEGVAACS